MTIGSIVTDGLSCTSRKSPVQISMRVRAHAGFSSDWFLNWVSYFTFVLFEIFFNSLKGTLFVHRGYSSLILLMLLYLYLVISVSDWVPLSFKTLTHIACNALYHTCHTSHDRQFFPHSWFSFSFFCFIYALWNQSRRLDCRSLEIARKISRLCLSLLTLERARGCLSSLTKFYLR